MNKLTLALGLAALIATPAFANDAAHEGHDAGAAAHEGAAHAAPAKKSKKVKKEVKTEEHSDSAHHE